MGRFRRYARVGVIALGPPLLFLAVWLFTQANAGSSPVEIRQAGEPIGRGTVEEAVATVARRTGLAVDLPSGDLASRYELAYVDSLLPGELQARHASVLLAFGRKSSATQTLSITVLPANGIEVPPALPEAEVRDKLRGKIYWVGARPSDSPEKSQMQLFARSSSLDVLVTFEGSPFPNEADAVELVASMLNPE